MDDAADDNAVLHGFDFKFDSAIIQQDGYTSTYFFEQFLVGDRYAINITSYVFCVQAK